METINIDKVLRHRDILEWALIAIFAESDQKFVKNIAYKKEDEDRIIEVELKINGIEVPFTHVIKTFDETYDKAVAKHAREIYESEYAGKPIDKIKKIQDVLNSVEDMVESIYNDNNPWGFRYGEEE